MRVARQQQHNSEKARSSDHNRHGSKDSQLR